MILNVSSRNPILIVQAHTSVCVCASPQAVQHYHRCVLLVLEHSV